VEESVFPADNPDGGQKKMQVSSFSGLEFVSNGLMTVVRGPVELVRGTEAEVLAELLPRVKQEAVALDLSGVERIDAAGIATLITLYCTAIEAGKSFSVLRPSSHVRTLLKVVGLEPILMDGIAHADAVRACCDRPAA
jgi:ABC-type transporter Mla MlaB component